MVDWSQLPYDIISLVANQLHVVEDFLSFSAVCRSWRFVYLNKCWSPSARIPWLMLNENYNSVVPMRRFFCTCMNKVYNVPLPEAHGRRCWGSSLGWLVTIGQDLEIHLLNPICRVRVNLPPYSTLENQVPANLYWFSFIHKATVFKIRDEFITVAMYGHRYTLAFARPGDSAWTSLQITSNVINVVCFKDRILALSMVGMLLLVDIEGPDPPRALYIASPPEDEEGWQQIYLVESSGELLMVFRYGGIDFCSRVTFKVYKFDIGTKEWKKLEDLGACVLFVGDAYCTSVSAVSAGDEFKYNSIYFEEDNLGFDGYYMGVYHMEDKTAEFFYLGDDSPLCYTCPIWVTPTL